MNGDHVKICRLPHVKPQMALQLLSAAGLFITAVMTVDECFDGILDLIHGLVTTLIGGIKGTVVFQYKQEGCCATKIQNKGL